MLLFLFYTALANNYLCDVSTWLATPVINQFSETLIPENVPGFILENDNFYLAFNLNNSWGFTAKFDSVG